MSFVEVKIGQDKSGQYVITFPYHPSVVDAVRQLPERRWNKTHRHWTVPKSTARQLLGWTSRLQGVKVVFLPGIKEEMDAVTEREEKSVVASRESESLIEVPVPEGLEYRPYQKAGIKYAISRSNTLFGDEMGLGKSIQAIGVGNADASIRSVLIICPASLKLNWRREWMKWDIHQRSVAIAGDSFPKADVVIVNYDQLKKHIGAIHSRSWDLLCADEAHYMKNSKALRTMYVVGGKKKKQGQPDQVFEPISATRKLLLTGTPILNKPIEAWTLVHYLAPEAFPSYGRYAMRYCGGHNNGYGFDATGSSNLEELQDRLRASIMVRRLKKDVLTELPAKRRQIIEIESEDGAVDRECEAYAHAKEKLEALKLAVELAKGGTDEEYQSAVEAMNQGAMAKFSEMARLRHDTAMAKLPKVIEHLTDAIESSGKVVCFAWHKDVIAGIAAAFPACLTMTGIPRWRSGRLT